MELLGTTSYICLAAAILSIVLPIKRSLLLLILSAPMTTVAVCNVGENCILIYQLLWFVLACKTSCLAFVSKRNLSFPLLAFLVYSLCTIPVVLLCGNELIINVDAELANPVLSFQQITQLAYLFIAISTAWMVFFCLRQGVVEKEDILRWNDYACCFVIVVAFLQLIMPAQVITEYLRNSIHSGYIWEGSRVSSTFQEPSMTSLYLAPIIAMKCLQLVERPRLFDFILLVGSLIVCIMNSSSSALLGFAAMALSFVYLFGRSKCKFSIPRAAIVLCSCAFVFMLFVIAVGGLNETVSALMKKLAGQNVSGQTRSFNQELMMGVFYRHPIFGIGWGTARAEGLGPTWLSELGLIGILLFAIPVIKTLHKLTFRGFYGAQLFSYLVTALAILMISAGEPYYLPFWIMFGLATNETGEVNPAINFAKFKEEEKKKFTKESAAHV